jgi:hypothetical protein
MLLYKSSIFFILLYMEKDYFSSSQRKRLVHTLIRWVALTGTCLALIASTSAAVVMPTNTPTGSTPGWLFAFYFQNLFANPCSSTEFMVRVDGNGKPVCKPYSSIIGPVQLMDFSLLSNGDTLYYNGTSWKWTKNLFNNWTNIWTNNPSPSEVLDIIGNVRVSGNVRVGGNLTGATSVSTQELCLNGTCVTSLGSNISTEAGDPVDTTTAQKIAEVKPGQNTEVIPNGYTLLYVNGNEDWYGGWQDRYSKVGWYWNSHPEQWDTCDWNNLDPYMCNPMEYRGWCRDVTSFSQTLWSEWSWDGDNTVTIISFKMRDISCQKYVTPARPANGKYCKTTIQTFIGNGAANTLINSKDVTYESSNPISIRAHFSYNTSFPMDVYTYNGTECDDVYQAGHSNRPMTGGWWKVVNEGWPTEDIQWTGNCGSRKVRIKANTPSCWNQ